jgi:hypothetical protein
MTFILLAWVPGVRRRARSRVPGDWGIFEAREKAHKILILPSLPSLDVQVAVLLPAPAADR